MGLIFRLYRELKLKITQFKNGQGTGTDLYSKHQVQEWCRTGSPRRSQQAGQSPWWLQSAASAVDWEQANLCAEQNTGYSQPSSPLMRLIFLVLGPRTGVSNMWLEPFAAQGGPLACPVTSHLLGHPLGLQVQTISLFPSYKIICIFSFFFFTAWFLGEPHC